MLYYIIIYTHISYTYNIMLNTNHDQEFCPSWPWATGGRKAILCGDFEERQRARALLELLPKAKGEKRCAMLCSKCGMAMDSKFSSSLKFNIFQHFHKFP